MPHEVGAELRAQERRPRAVQEARGKVVDAGGPDAPPAITHDLHLRLTATGEVRVYRVPLVGQNLVDFLRVTAERTPDVRVFIHAPKQVAHATLVGVMEKVKAAGLREMTIATE